MNDPSPDMDRRLSREEFRRWCDAQPRGRFERMDGRIVAMAAERGAHLRVKAAAFLALRQAIATAGVDCQALPDGATVETGDSDYQPDALVNCGERPDQPRPAGHCSDDRRFLRIGRQPGLLRRRRGALKVRASGGMNDG